MLWDTTETHQPEYLCATLADLPLSWDGNMVATLSVVWSCQCGRTQAFSSTFVPSTGVGVWAEAQYVLTALCRQLGLTGSLALLPVSSSGSVMSWEATWRRPRP